MSILVFTENWDGAFRKSSFEAVSYAFSIAQKKSTNVVAVSVGEVNNEELKPGERVLIIESGKLRIVRDKTSKE